MSSFSTESSHYHLPSTRNSAAERRTVSSSQWPETDSASQVGLSIGVSTSNTDWTTQSDTTQSSSGVHRSNQLPVPLIDFGAIEPHSSVGIAHERHSSSFGNGLRGDISSQHPGSRPPVISRGCPVRQRQDPTQDFGDHEVTRFPSDAGVRDRGRSSTGSIATRTNGSLQCPKCSKSFKRRHQLKYDLPGLDNVVPY